MNKSSKIFVAGHRGMVGSGIVRELQNSGYTNLILRTSSELDLRNQESVNRFFSAERPEFVFLAAAKVGGIHANNSLRAEFIYDNLAIELNVIHASHEFNVRKLLFLGSSCIYPKNATIPLKEESLLSGYLEMTNEPYAIAKIAGIKLCEAFRDQYGCNFIAAMPTNLYGPNDNYDLTGSHVLPAMIRKFHDAFVNQKSEVVLWGTGNPRREFLHVKDLSRACIALMLDYNDRQFVNVGSGEEVSIAELAAIIAGISGFKGKIVWDSNKPDGVYRKLMDSTRIRSMGWLPEIKLADGIQSTFQEYKSSFSLNSAI